MKLVAVAGLALVLFLSCSSSDSPAPVEASSGPLQGAWIYAPDTKSALQLTFDGDTWRMLAIETLTSGGYAAEVTSGTFALSESNITLTLTASSCEGVQAITDTVKTGTAVKRGSSLTLTVSTSLTVFQLGTSPTGMASAQVGCIVNGTFTAHAVTPVP